MPSHQLSELCAQIEKQDTDHFGKFYMYVSLLNTVTDRRKTFDQGLPQYNRGLALWRNNTLNLGHISPDFKQQTQKYSTQFINENIDKARASRTLFMTYFRKSTISDLAYIIDQMLFHLTHVDEHLNQNKNLYDYLDFANKKAGLTVFIKQVSDFNKLLLSIADDGIHWALSAIVALAGAIVILASVFTLIPSLVGLGLMLGGIAAATYFVTEVAKQGEQVKPNGQLIAEKIRTLPQDRSIFGNDANHHAFFTSAITPFSYVKVTALEQLAATPEMKAQAAWERERLNQLTTMIRP
ncbi:MAG: hypothetical protein P4L65_02945 [Legionella sp.]|nr:hypothetical protein [Legionella sp.]